MVNRFTGSSSLWLDQADFQLDCDLVTASQTFDESGYISRAGPEAARNPIGHYLSAGWRQGTEPNSWFPGTLFLPYYTACGFVGPPLINWLVQRAARWNAPPTWSETLEQANRVRVSGLFDESFYARQLGPEAAGLDLAIHYVLAGERLGFAPSAEFDPRFYLACYPDVGRAGVNFLLHYQACGRDERRHPFAARTRRSGGAKEDSGKENVIMVVHNTSRTGAPVLGWNMVRELGKKYNVFTIRMGDGELTEHFEAESVEVHGPYIGSFERSFVYLDSSLQSLFASRKFRFAILNSVETRWVLESLNSRFIPALLLMHEFAYFVQPQSDLTPMFERSDEIIFSARSVARSAEDLCPALLARSSRILIQGASELPDRKSSNAGTTHPVLETLARLRDVENAFIVVNAGYVQVRKGVDLFLAAAATVARAKSNRPIYFLWVGDGYDPIEDDQYGIFLFNQIRRSGLERSVLVIESIPDLTPVYEIADAFFLSSRLDPFPNVAIDAMKSGIPLICFRDAGGAPDLLLTSQSASEAVVDYLDGHAAGELIVRLAADADLHGRLAEAMRALADSHFSDMSAYVASVEAAGTKAAERVQQRQADAETLIHDLSFDEFMFLGADYQAKPRSHAIVDYLTLKTIEQVRRPCPGFHPYRYKAEHPKRMLNGENPLAEFVRDGKPAGPWFLPVLRPDDPAGPRGGDLRVALHAHFYYPELADDFLGHLHRNHSRCDLLISTDTEAKAQQLRSVFANYQRGSFEISITPNRGRDIGPLLTEFAGKLTGYDIVGHVHAKRSLIVGDAAVGENWRQFLWQHLLGGQHPVLDRIVAAFEQDEQLGLVFPSDPHLIGWSANRELAATLAARMGWRKELPDYFDFPLGTMFWMRCRALEPLLKLDFKWDDYPEEPVPYDGTILHAIERLLPFVNELAGFTSAVTHVLGAVW